MTDHAYSEADANRDRRALDAALGPLVGEWLAARGLTHDQALAMLRAGQPCPAAKEEPRDQPRAA